jgi:ribosomal-protein-alanine N-acetyltransferase
MSKVYFEKMQKSDIEPVFEIEIRNYPIPWNKELFLDCLKTGYHCIVLKKLNTIIGYSILMTAYDESHLLNMCVDNPQQGKGYGRKMLKYLENICLYSHSKIFLLEVRESNLGAQNLYKSFGFKQIGVRKNYYRCLNGHENALVMTKKVFTGTS